MFEDVSSNIKASLFKLTFDPIPTNAIHKQTSLIFFPLLFFFTGYGYDVGYGALNRCEMELYKLFYPIQ